MKRKIIFNETRLTFGNLAYRKKVKKKKTVDHERGRNVWREFEAKKMNINGLSKI